jgi:predicted Mrr-cat superfamily restriction endonuclease
MTPDVAKFTREKIFVDILESVHPTEAQLVLDMVFKRKQTADGLTPKLILEAFPGLFPLTKKE